MSSDGGGLQDHQALVFSKLLCNVEHISVLLLLPSFVYLGLASTCWYRSHSCFAILYTVLSSPFVASCYASLANSTTKALLSVLAHLLTSLSLIKCIIFVPVQLTSETWLWLFLSSISLHVSGVDHFMLFPSCSLDFRHCFCMNILAVGPHILIVSWSWSSSPRVNWSGSILWHKYLNCSFLFYGRFTTDMFICILAGLLMEGSGFNSLRIYPWSLPSLHTVQTHLIIQSWLIRFITEMLLAWSLNINHLHPCWSAASFSCSMNLTKRIWLRNPHCGNRYSLINVH